jgi:threonine dehydrogenase-like Zn-dependent dehydrogenase
MLENTPGQQALITSRSSCSIDSEQTMMQKTMKAWRLYAINDIRLDEVPIPEAGPGEVLLKTRVIQPSISEVLLIRGDEPMSPGDSRILKERAPYRMFGHEFCAEVVALGAGVTRFKVGDRVAPRGLMPCGQCPLCKAGHWNGCRSGIMVGHQVPGLYAEYGALPEQLLARLPNTLDDQEGALIQTLHACVGAVAQARIDIGDTAAVIGMGSIGSFVLQVARVSGISRIMAIDIRDESLALAKMLGADAVINGIKDDVISTTKEFTNGVGVDIVFECAGGSPKQGLSGTASLHQALAIVRNGGQIVVSSQIAESEPLTLGEYRGRGIDLLFPEDISLKTLEHSVNLASSGRVKLAPIISHTLEGIEKLPEAMEITANKKKYGTTSPAQVIVAKN